MIRKQDTRVSFNSEVGHELSLWWGPVQNQNLHFRGPKYACCLRHSALLAKAYQEITLDIGLETFPSLVSISEEKECVTITLLKPLSSEDALTLVKKKTYMNQRYKDIKSTIVHKGPKRVFRKWRSRKDQESQGLEDSRTEVVESPSITCVGEE